MVGLYSLYFSSAEDYVQLHRKKGTLKKISRAEFELQLLNEIENAELPIKYKLSFYHAVLTSLAFEPFWLAISQVYHLSELCIARYVTDEALLEFQAATEDDDEEVVQNDAKDKIDQEADDDDDGIRNEMLDDADADADTDAVKLISPTSGPSSTPATHVTDHATRSSSPDSDDGYRSSSPESDTELLKRAALMPKRTIIRCAECNGFGHSARYCTAGRDDLSPWGSDSEVEARYEAEANARLRYVGLLRCEPIAEEVDDGENKDSPSKGKEKAKVMPTVKGASKPKGVTKNKAAPKQKQQTPAQLKTAAAKSREPAKPPKAKKESAKKEKEAPAQMNVAAAKALEPTPAVQANMGSGGERGTKRSLEHLHDDEDESRATKVAKVGGAASANGGRKKVTPKKREQSPFQEWDGVYRGFGEY